MPDPVVGRHERVDTDVFAQVDIPTPPSIPKILRPRANPMAVVWAREDRIRRRRAFRRIGLLVLVTALFVWADVHGWTVPGP